MVTCSSRPSNRRPVARRVGGALVALVLLATPLAALAQRPPAGASGVSRPVRFEGFWERTRAAREVIGEITISSDGERRRSFGVTALQAYIPEEEGLHVFRHSSLQPVTLFLRGDRNLITRFMTAPPDRKITAFGVYRGGSGAFVLTSVELVPPAKVAD